MARLRRLIARLQTAIAAGKGDEETEKVYADAELAIEFHRRTILDLELRQSKLEQDIRRVDAELLSRVTSGDKISALQSMKRKKLLQAEVHKIGNEKLKLEAIIFSLNSAITSKIAFEALAELSAKHANLLRRASPDKIEKLMDRIAQQQCVQNHIDNLMEVDTSVVPNDELLEAELIHLEDQQIHNKISQIEPAPIAAPQMPTSQEEWRTWLAKTSSTEATSLFDDVAAETIAQFQGALVL